MNYHQVIFDNIREDIEFLPLDYAIKLKELKFNDYCNCTYHLKSSRPKFPYEGKYHFNYHHNKDYVSAPNFITVERWLNRLGYYIIMIPVQVEDKVKYKAIIYVKDKGYFYIEDKTEKPDTKAVLYRIIIFKLINFLYDKNIDTKLSYYTRDVYNDWVDIRKLN